ncbi:MAG: hypothetical protein KBG20_08430 [Caldilineaceae bacterium]|nr:hypothetical protein [Caldilineaceae bacterium]MBP8109762.1 hypothetical protein [Caldilineaceae bacterium]MBP8124546.1 hypothetical protein [Caldilineaceae bacterium]MBP9072310.1 hypothetical protein [Caldilineaceae bacterium]
MNRYAMTFPQSLARLRTATLPPRVEGQLARLGLTAFDPDRANALDHHFHQVVVGRGERGEAVVANIKLAPLTSLAEELGRTVTPVQPPPRFRQDLGAALTDAHRQRMAQRTLGTATPPPQPSQTSRGVWVIVLLAILGVLIWRRRRGRRGRIGA